MRIEGYKTPKSSFLAQEKDMAIITNMMLKNDRLKRLLYYASSDCMSRPKLTDEQTAELFGKHIKLVPKLTVDGSVLSYIIISFDNFSPNYENPEFRDNVIEFDVICHMDQWQLKDFQLRPYRIAAELDSMFDKTHLTGIGTLDFVGASQIILNSEYAGLCLMYKAIHGEEDKKYMPNPADEDKFIQEFKEMYST